MKFTLFVLLLSVISAPAFCQNDSGIFLSIKCGKKMQRQTVVLTGKQICLAPQPIIVPNEFDNITQVKQEEELIYMDLTFSDKAVTKLRQLASSLPESTFALVVDKQVFQVFEAGEVAINRTFRFEARLEQQSDFFEIQEKLKVLISGGTE